MGLFPQVIASKLPGWIPDQRIWIPDDFESWIPDSQIPIRPSRIQNLKAESIDTRRTIGSVRDSSSSVSLDPPLQVERSNQSRKYGVFHPAWLRSPLDRNEKRKLHSTTRFRLSRGPARPLRPATTPALSPAMMTPFRCCSPRNTGPGSRAG